MHQCRCIPCKHRVPQYPGQAKEGKGRRPRASFRGPGNPRLEGPPSPPDRAHPAAGRQSTGPVERERSRGKAPADPAPPAPGPPTRLPPERSREDEAEAAACVTGMKGTLKLNSVADEKSKFVPAEGAEAPPPPPPFDFLSAMAAAHRPLHVCEEPLRPTDRKSSRLGANTLPHLRTTAGRHEARSPRFRKRAWLFFARKQDGGSGFAPAC